MRINDTVNYFDPSGNRHHATVTEVTGSGKSGYKTLDLTYQQDGEAVSVEGVVHELDDKGAGFWLGKGQQRTEPEIVKEPTSGKKPKK